MDGGEIEREEEEEEVIPKLFVWDLDGTLWSPEMYQLYGGSPFSLHLSSLDLKDRRGERVSLLGDAREILKEWKEKAKFAVASSCDEPEWARECIEFGTLFILSSFSAFFPRLPSPLPFSHSLPPGSFASVTKPTSTTTSTPLSPRSTKPPPRKSTLKRYPVSRASHTLTWSSLTTNITTSAPWLPWGWRVCIPLMVWRGMSFDVRWRCFERIRRERAEKEREFDGRME